MLRRSLLTLAARAGLAVLVLARAAAAGDLPAPSGDVLLTVDGQIPRGSAGHAARFDRAMLQAMPVTTFETATIWTRGEHRFTGVQLKDLLDRLGITSGTLSAVAINDYAVQIPVSDAVAGGPIVAYAMDGRPMSVRDKGPLWIVYPYDSKSKYRSEVIYSRSIWQLVHLTVKP